jgi:YhcH/YjgK/YiaL family protein
MVIDTLENMGKYLSEAEYAKIQEFLQTCSNDMEEGYYELEGKDIYARVMSYQTAPRTTCKIEAHNQYIDIQSTLVGSEGIDVFHRDSLSVQQPYDEKKDVVILGEDKAEYVTVNNLPGYFTMLFPEEAHKPKISLNDQGEQVKKFVIKIRIQSEGEKRGI